MNYTTTKWLLIISCILLIGSLCTSCRTRKVSTDITKSVDKTVVSQTATVHEATQDSSKRQIKDLSTSDQKTSETAQIKIIDEYFDKPTADGVRHRRTTIADINKQSTKADKSNVNIKETIGSSSITDHTTSNRTDSDVKTTTKTKNTKVASIPVSVYIVGGIVTLLLGFYIIRKYI